MYMDYVLYIKRNVNGFVNVSRFGLKVHCGMGSRTFSTRRNPFTFLFPEAISWCLADFGL